LSKIIIEDCLVHEYGNMLCENDSQLNPYNYYNTIVPNHTNSKDLNGNCALCNKLDEYTRQGWLCVFNMVVVKGSNTISIFHLNLVMTIISQIYFSGKTIHKYGLIHFCSIFIDCSMSMHMSSTQNSFFSSSVKPSFQIVCASPHCSLWSL
jgi:hypothetical protein